MKKTLKEFLDFFGVKEGDIIELNNNKYTVHLIGPGVPTLGDNLPLQALIDEEYRIITPTKVGDLRCGCIKCDECPFAYLDCNDVPENVTLYKGLKIIFNNKTDNPLYKIVKKELDKNVDPKSK